MIKGLLINPQLEKNVGKQLVTCTLNPYTTAEGPIRAMQKFLVILLTTVGSDSMRPWFGTYMPQMLHMNIVNRTETQLFIREQVSEAIRQFFKLQSGEATQNNQEAIDLISSIELKDLTINNSNQIFLNIKFTPVKQESIIYSLKLGGTT
jgi:phage baseplate assembly protein W